MEIPKFNDKYTIYPFDHSIKQKDKVYIIRLIYSNFFRDNGKYDFRDDINLIKEIKLFNDCYESRFFIDIDDSFSAPGLIALNTYAKSFFSKKDYFILSTYSYVGENYECFRCIYGYSNNFFNNIIGKRFNITELVEEKDDNGNYDLPF